MAQKKNIQFSIVIPIYNTHLLGEVLECFSMQTYHTDDFEILIIDDGSCGEFKNRYASILEKYVNLDIRYEYMGQKKGMMRANIARNRGVIFSKYEQIIFLDSDCLVPEYYLENYEKAIQFNKNIDIIIGKSIGYTFPNTVYIEPSAIIEKRYEKFLLDIQYQDFRENGGYTKIWHVFLGGNFSISKNLAIQIGWDEKIISWGEDDIDFAFRANKAGLNFCFGEKNEIYNIATSQRLTKEKFYSVMQNQCYLFKKYDFDTQYYDYVVQRFINTPREFIPHKVSSRFQELFLK